MKQTVVFLLSDKRSGSTFFEKALCANPGVQHVAYTPHTFNETHYWVKSACLLEMPTRFFSRHKRPRGYGKRDSLRRSLENFLTQNIPDFVFPASDEELVFAGWEALCDRFAEPVFFEKSPQHPHHWAALELFLRWAETTDKVVKVVGLVRNPMAVLYSAQQLFDTDPSERQYSWFEAYSNLLLFSTLIAKDQFMMMRYEDLVSEEAIQTRKLYEFIGMEAIENGENTAHQLSLEKWKEDPAFSLSLDKSVARLANYLGYSEEQIFNPNGKSKSKTDALASTLGATLHRLKGIVYNRYRRYLE